MATELISGTEVEEEMRKFKGNVLKSKEGKKRIKNDGTIVMTPAALLGPGYWRGFMSRNGSQLIHQKAQNSSTEVVEQEQHDQLQDDTEIMEGESASAPLIDVTNAEDLEEKILHESLEVQLQRHEGIHEEVVHKDAQREVIYEEDVHEGIHEEDVHEGIHEDVHEEDVHDED
eukprot:CAMPEP_0171300482 /NCGR_PEP_ID=MMETSP0816-20121228/9295_1 /TAXON_ID=420281 /ORGANISM="Proboscia inermis, Strain CCAP1064/1" /LENGTH=172 /DNA_ID=CAMNT_0011776999 /DNA_START=53 /DNA_END=568 /DNA_ORIENTATION=-